MLNGDENSKKKSKGLIRKKKTTLHVQHTSFVHFFAVVLQDSGVEGKIRNSFQNIQI